MKKRAYVFLVLLLTLSGCTTPNYGSEKESSQVIETTSGTEVATYNGYVIEVTEDNMVRIRVPKRGEMIQKGWAINEQGIIMVALASVKIPMEGLPLSNETNDALKELLLNKEVTLDVLEEAVSTNAPKTNSLNVLPGYIHLKDSDTSIQEVLIENGLAIIDKSEPFVNSYMSDLETLQILAKENSLGVWAIDGFVKLNNSLDGNFTDMIKVNEAEVNTIIQDIKTKGKDLEKIFIK